MKSKQEISNAIEAYSKMKGRLNNPFLVIHNEGFIDALQWVLAPEKGGRRPAARKV